MITSRSRKGVLNSSTANAPGPTRSWLLFVSQLPTSPSNLRVRTWRRLQQLGAIPVKQAVYALPDTPGAREDFEWLKAAVIGDGGEASIFAATSVDAWADDALVEDFRRARQSAYAALSAEVEAVLARVARPRRGKRAPSVDRLARGFSDRLAALERIDFFGSAGRDRVVALLRRLESQGTASVRSAATDTSADPPRYVERLWVTRPRPGVDRMSSAWLIRRFIDPDARFEFAPDVSTLAEGAVAFDMFGAEFSHRGDGCTFETLRDVFAVKDAAVDRLATIVHDLDLKDGRFGAPEANTVGTLIEGMQLATADDAALLEQGIALFDSLHRAFSQALRTTGPRATASSAKAGAQARRPKR
jgi:hypothetical protein